MRREPIRVYADTSVFGGVFEPGNDGPSKCFFDLVDAGRFELVTSIVVTSEIVNAPEAVRSLYERVIPPPWTRTPWP